MANNSFKNALIGRDFWDTLTMAQTVAARYWKTPSKVPFGKEHRDVIDFREAFVSLLAGAPNAKVEAAIRLAEDQFNQIENKTGGYSLNTSTQVRKLWGEVAADLSDAKQAHIDTKKSIKLEPMSKEELRSNLDFEISHMTKLIAVAFGTGSDFRMGLDSLKPLSQQIMKRLDETYKKIIRVFEHADASGVDMKALHESFVSLMRSPMHKLAMLSRTKTTQAELDREVGWMVKDFNVQLNLFKKELSSAKSIRNHTPAHEVIKSIIRSVKDGFAPAVTDNLIELLVKARADSWDASKQVKADTAVADIKRSLAVKSVVDKMNEAFRIAMQFNSFDTPNYDTLLADALFNKMNGFLNRYGNPNEIENAIESAAFDLAALCQREYDLYIGENVTPIVANQQVRDNVYSDFMSQFEDFADEVIEGLEALSDNFDEGDDDQDGYGGDYDEAGY